MSRRWTEEELEILEKLRFKMPICRIAKKLNRTPCSVQSKLCQTGKRSYPYLTTLYTVQDVCEHAGVCKETIFRAIKSGKIVPAKVLDSKPAYYFSEEQLREIQGMFRKKVRLTEYEKQQIKFMHNVKKMRTIDIARKLNKPGSTVDNIVNGYSERCRAKREAARNLSDSKTIPQKSEAS